MPCVGKGSAGISLGILLCSIPVLFVCLFFPQGPASPKSLFFFLPDAAFSTPVPHDRGQAANAWPGDFCQLEAGDKGDPGGGHSQSVPITPGVLCLFGVEGEADASPRLAASLPFIPGSSRMRWESVVPSPQHPFGQCHQHGVRPMTEALVPPKEKAAGVRF